MQGAEPAVSLAAVLALAGLLQLADVLTTLRALRHGRREANPLVRAMMRRFGRLWWVPKLIVAGAGMALVWMGRDGALARPAAWALVAIGAWAAWSNWRRGAPG